MTQPSDAQIKHMVDRFLGWKLPENFNPDGGITFKRFGNEHSSEHRYEHRPVGTNLLTATQADEMVRYMLGGQSEVSSLCVGDLVLMRWVVEWKTTQYVWEVLAIHGDRAWLRSIEDKHNYTHDLLTNIVRADPVFVGSMENASLVADAAVRFPEPSSRWQASRDALDMSADMLRAASEIGASGNTLFHYPDNEGALAQAEAAARKVLDICGEMRALT